MADVNTTRPARYGFTRAAAIEGIGLVGSHLREALTIVYRASRGLDPGIARIFNTYASRIRADDGRAVPVLIRRARTDETATIAADGSQMRSIRFVSDIVAGVIGLAANAQPGPVKLGNTQEMTVEQFARRVVELGGSWSPVSFAEQPVDRATRLAGRRAAANAQ